MDNISETKMTTQSLIDEMKFLGHSTTGTHEELFKRFHSLHHPGVEIEIISLEDKKSRKIG